MATRTAGAPAPSIAHHGNGSFLAPCLTLVRLFCICSHSIAQNRQQTSRGRKGGKKKKKKRKHETEAILSIKNVLALE